MATFSVPITKKIFNDSGNLTSLALVSRDFCNMACEKASEIYQSLVQHYGPVSVQGAIHSLTAKEKTPKSPAFIVDQLFARATKRKIPISTDPYSPLHLDDVMAPYLDAEGIDALYYAIFHEANPSLKNKMVQQAFSADPLIRAQQRRDFLEQNCRELAGIQELSLRGAGVRQLPPEFSWLVNLRKLYLSGNHFPFLPAQVFKLHHLEVLIADNCSLLGLPTEIGQLKRLRILSLNENRMIALPAAVGELVELRVLSAGYNKLKRLPASLKKLQNLENLYLYNNQLKEVPEEWGELRALKVFSASKNQLSSLPEGFSRLSQLQLVVLDDNAFQFFPGCLKTTPILREVILTRNQLMVFLEDFPQGVRVHVEGNPSIGVAYPMVLRKRPQQEFAYIYFCLGGNKWKEFLDFSYHPHGPDVMDQGKFREKEPGFLESMVGCVRFLKENYFRRLDYPMYTELMRLSVSHLTNIREVTGWESDGVWRRMDENCPEVDLPKNTFTPLAKREFRALNDKIACLFGPSYRLGEIISPADDPATWEIKLFRMTRDQRDILFHLFLSEFHLEMQRAKVSKEFAQAIVRFTKNLEWLHCQKNELRRGDKLLMDFLLSEYGVHPTLMDTERRPPCCFSFEEWFELVVQGLRNWELEVKELKESRERVDVDGEADAMPLDSDVL